MIEIDQQKLNKLFPTPADKEKLFKLVRIIQGATNENEIKSEIQRNFSELAGTIINVVRCILKI